MAESLQLAEKAELEGLKRQFFQVRRKKQTLFIECDLRNPVAELKRAIEGIIHVPIEDQWLLLASTGDLMKDDMVLTDFDLKTEGLNFPVIHLLLRDEKDPTRFEEVDIVDYTKPSVMQEVIVEPEQNNPDCAHDASDAEI